MKPAIIYENDQFIVVDKPSGLLSIPDREGKDLSLKVLLQGIYGKIFTVHRLDRDTSGLIVFAKTEESHRFLSDAFESRKVDKRYLGIVPGCPAEKKKRLELPLMEHPVKRGTMVVNARGKEAITEYEVLEEWGRFSLLEFNILTGRTHQIRVHLQHEGHPIICDELYGDPSPILLSTYKKKFKLAKKEEEERPLMKRLALHAWKLSLPTLNGEQLQLEAPLPRDMRAFQQQMQKLKKK